ncbi:MAG: ATP-dependent 6-phosphofructokinase [Deltaproteobacteria bacterium]|nr:MAG: ATP-dependent 6-phosphofructokinase [Deltaproteobacteria bacterium]
MGRRVGILTGGGDAPGLNAVIRAFVKRGAGQLGWDVVGIEDSFDGLMDRPRRVHHLTPVSCQGLLHRGGTILGTTNRGDPFAFPSADGPRDRRRDLVEGVKAEGLEGLVVIGGDGSQAIGLRVMEELGIPVIGVPKTIDNDLSATDLTFGFQSAVDVATDALDRLHTTAESHDRVMFLEVMGRDAGHIALHAGLAGGADVILLPEIPYDPHEVAEKVRRRKARGRPFSLIVVAEGALPAREDGSAVPHDQVKPRLKRGGGAAAIAMAQLEGLVDAEMRHTVLGHIQRGGSPVPFDRILATRFGVAAVDLVAEDRWGEMVRLQNGKVGGVPIREAIATYRLVDVHGEMMRTARAVGVEFGERG